MPIPPDAFVIIVGAMKAATSTLFYLLSQHPRICPSEIKEPEFFTRHHDGLSVQSYEEVFAFDSQHHDYCLEASTGYTKFPREIDVPSRMKAYGITPRIIYVVRDPLERIESEYNFAHLNNKPWAKPEMLHPDALHKSMYYMQMHQYLQVYPDKEGYLILDFDDITRRPHEVCDAVFSWLGLSAFEPEDDARNVTPRRSRVEQRIRGSSIEWGRYLPIPVRKFVRRFLRRIDSSAKQELSPDEQAKARRWLQYDIQRFGSTFGFPVEKWGFDPC